jgi:hypothetical protein
MGINEILDRLQTSYGICMEIGEDQDAKAPTIHRVQGIPAGAYIVIATYAYCHCNIATSQIYFYNIQIDTL